jgi:hypothetical protein
MSMMPEARVEAVEAGRPLPVEEVPPGEEQAINDMIEELKRELTSRYDPPAVTRRDAHPKHHGLARAQFRVDPSCPVELRHGVFARPGRSYAAEIRFSNGNPVVSHDLTLDVRGAGIKLDTDDRSLLGDLGQDFLLATGETFFGRDAVDFKDFPKASTNPASTAKYFLKPHRIRGLWQYVKSIRVPASPLAATYFSQSPYRLGPHCVKYQLRPAVRRRSAGDPWFMRPIIRHVLGVLLFFRLPGLQRVPGFDALRDALHRDLVHDHVTLEFFVQRWPDLSRLPVWAIEDPRRRWDAPWLKVATIVVSQQDDATSDKRIACGERMNFNPWRARQEHQPLGGINRARRRIYREMSIFRNERNGVEGKPDPCV